MDYSFYGGRPGQSMVIVKYFSSIEEMNTAFNQGDSYTEVGYGECVLINTKDSRNLENGRLYKRGLQKPEYLGTIKGPAGYPPHMELADYDLINKPADSGWGEEYYYADGKFSFKGEDTNAQDLVPGKTGEGDNKSYTDDILWKTLSIRKKIYKWLENGTLVKVVEDDPTIKSIDESTSKIVLQINNTEKTITYDPSLSEEETVVQVGFKIPYHVFDWEAESITPYEKDYRPSLESDKNSYAFTGDIKYTKLITDADIKEGEKQHPFYSDLKIKIPQGVKGDSIKGLRTMTKEEYFNLKDSNKENNETHLKGKHDLYEDSYSGSGEDRDDSLILVYEYYDYRNNKDGDKITKYLGDYNMIKSIGIDGYGTVTIEYTHENTETFENLIRWIENIQLNEDTGILDIRYNTPLREGESGSHWYKDSNNKAHYKAHLRWVEDISLAENGEVTLHFTQGDKEIEDSMEVINQEDPIKWIKHISVGADGTIKIYYNTTINNDKESYEENGQAVDYSVFAKALNWIKDFDLNPSSGNLTVTFNNNNLFNGEYQVGLEWVKDVKLEDGILTFTFTQKDGVENATYSELLDWIQNISIAQNGEVILTHSYRESEPPRNFRQTILDNKLQWVEDIDVTPKGDLVVSYNTDAVFETYVGENISLDGCLDVSTEAKSIYELYNDKEYLYQYQLSKMPEVPDSIKENIVYGTFIGQTGTNIENVIFDCAKGTIKTTRLLYDLGTGAGLAYSPSSVLIKNNSNILDRNFKWVEKINITEDGEVISNYNYTNDAGQKVSMVQDDKLTWIKDMRLDTQNYQLIAIDNHGEEIRLGSTKVDSTLSIAFNIRPDETLTISETEKIQAGFTISDNLAYLNRKFPKGLDINANGDSINEEWMKGKIITVGSDSLEEIDQRKNFYAFDYNRNQWYYLGTLSGMGALKYQQIAEKEKEENINSAMERLDIGGVCYITTQRPNNAIATLDFILDLEE